MARTSKVYLIHLESPIADHARHYLGSAQNLPARIAHHLDGTGAKLLRAANERGISWKVVRTWEAPDGDGRMLERQLKDQKNAARFCPECQEAKLRIAENYTRSLLSASQ